MKKYSKKLVTLLVLMLAMTTMLLSSCGAPKTLEEYVNSDKELQEEIDSYKDVENSSLIVKDNKLTFEYKFGEDDIPEGMEELLKTELKKQMDTQGDTFANIAGQLEEQTELEGIEVEVTYKSAGGDVLYTNSYKAK